MSLLTKIRAIIIFFIIALVVCGITASPAETELRWLLGYKEHLPVFMANWLQNCYNALADTNNKYPMLAYGYDWLAFAHIIIAIALIGPFKDPIKNIWVIEWQMIACVAVIPLAFIAGPVRQIPFFHLLIDCSFGILGLIPLYICRKWIKKLEAEESL